MFPPFMEPKVSLSCSLEPATASCILGDLKPVHNFAPNVAVEWLALLLYIVEVPGSNIGPGDRLC
jgi:hypothetical protein